MDKAADRKKIIQASADYYQHYLKPQQDFSPGDKIPYGGRVFDELEIEQLIDASLDFWLTAGSYTNRFETELSRFLGIKYSCLVNSGSSANLLAFMTMTSPELGPRRILPGDEVITIAAGFPTTVAPIIQYGAIPVFIDVNIPEYNANCLYLEKALSFRTKAVMLAHTMGNPFDLVAVKDFCHRHGLWLIEDNCDALGSRFCLHGEWRYTGTIGDIGTSSFYPSHQITTGEGGAIYTNNAQLYHIAQSLRDWGRDCCCPPGKDDTCQMRFGQQWGELPFGYDHKYVYSHFGYNLKALDLQAAIGCAQLSKLPRFIVARRNNWQYLQHRLAPLADRLILPRATPASDPCWFGYVLTVRPGSSISRDEFVRRLEESGIQCRMLFAGNLLKHPCFDEMRAKGCGYRVVGDLENTDQVMFHTFWVGVYPGLTDKMLDYMANALLQIAGGI